MKQNASANRKSKTSTIKDKFDLPLILIENDVENIFNKITKREKEVTLWITSGKTNWEISIILEIREDSVKEHVSSILKKLNANNRAHIVSIVLDEAYKEFLKKISYKN